MRNHILKALHAAHQGVSSMHARANASVYWPGMNQSIRNTRYNCYYCNEQAPVQSKEPITLTEPPTYPFQKVCADYFTTENHSYLAYVDRFSGWISIFHFQPHQATSSKLITEFRSLFTNYGTPEEVSTDGGPQFTSTAFQDFLSAWGVHHRLSSAHYPQSNGRAELAVKTSKRIILNNINANGTLDNDNAARAILQYRNTPIAELGLSPSQLLFHRQLRDSIPTNPTHYQLHKNWIISANQWNYC